MKKFSQILFLAIAVLGVTSLVTWQATGGDWYTKYEVVEQVEVKLDASDPLVAAGFYDGVTSTRTVTRDEFRLGLLPTAAGLLDKHVVSVASINGPLWLLGLGLFWFERRRSRQN